MSFVYLCAGQWLPSIAVNTVCSLKRTAHVYTAVGSIPERDDNKLYNSCPVFDPSGAMVAKYRKIYLANTFVPGQLVVKESDVFTEGDKPAIIDTG